MVSISIVVGLGCYGGIPNNRAEVSKLEAIPLKEFEDKPSGFDPRTSTNCGFVRTRKGLFKKPVKNEKDLKTRSFFVML